MKKALLLVGFIMCGASGFAAETHADLTSDGKKRNEDAYEKMLEQTGWKGEKTAKQNTSDDQHTQKRAAESSQLKSS